MGPYLSSLLGCPQCYEVYGKLLGPALERLHGADTHHGRRPGDPRPPGPGKEADPGEEREGT